MTAAIALRQRAHDVRMLGTSTLVAFAMLWAALITWLSAQPSLHEPRHGLATHVLFNSGHAPLFGVLAAAVAFALSAQLKRPIPELTACAIAFVATAAFGALDEFHQSFVPGRTSSWTDVVTDSLGAAITLYGLRYLAGPRATIAGFAARVFIGGALMIASGAGATYVDNLTSQP